MTREALLDRLREIPRDWDDSVQIHRYADEALLEYIDDPAIEEAYLAIEKVYA